jgi:hypothetical protein
MTQGELRPAGVSYDKLKAVSASLKAVPVPLGIAAVSLQAHGRGT